MDKYKFQKWLKDLFSICKSITGNGLRQTLSYFEKINPELKRLKFQTGVKVFDWTIPKEWNIFECYIKHQSGKKFEDFKKNVICGFGLSCVGDNRAFSIIESRSKDTPADIALKRYLKKKKNLKIYSFLERGSDERQFYLPGINLTYVWVL